MILLNATFYLYMSGCLLVFLWMNKSFHYLTNASIKTQALSTWWSRRRDL